MTVLGEKTVHEYVKFIPAKLKRMVIKTQTLICRCLEADRGTTTLVQAQAPKLPLPQSIASPEMLAEVMTQKFLFGVPFYRQLHFWKRLNLDLSDRTLCNWVQLASEKWLQLVYDRLHAHLVNEDALHGDETPYTILTRSDGKSGSKKAYIWHFRTLERAKYQIAFFHANESRGRQVITNLLPTFSGYMQCDGYAAYRNIDGCQLVGCWAHLRRKFREVPGNDGKAKIGLDYCNQLFMLERKFKKLSQQQRYEQRQQYAKPIIHAFYEWIDSFIVMKGALATAISYALNQKEQLQCFLKDGRLELSNNLAERGIRPITIGRKNYLFSKTNGGAKVNAIVYTLIETAKANGLDPQTYLEYLLTHLPNCDDYLKKSTIEAFLPWSQTVQRACVTI